MYYLDLFSGIGGFALGAYWAGWRFDEHYFSEIDDYCVKLYKTRFPAAIPLGNIAKINVSDLPQAEWFITGGFPCQDISIAGKETGIGGTRSSLWFEMWRIIRILRPRFAIIENVGAITHRGLDTVFGCLAEIGYDAEWQDIRASDVGAPHKRERIWVVAYPKRISGGGGNAQRGNDERRTTAETESTGIQPENGKPHTGNAQQGRQNVADTIIQQEGTTHPQEIRRTDGDDVGNSSSTLADPVYTSRTCRRQDTRVGMFKENTGTTQKRDWKRTTQWAIEPDVGRLAHGVSHRVDRLKALGNSIVPQIAELLFRQIGEIID